jgi:hypothetical protein
MAPRPRRREPGSIFICSDHGPLYFVETADPEASKDLRLRRSGLGFCDEGLAAPFAQEIGLLAVEAIPACTELDGDAFRYTADLLRACAILSGDSVAAAQVYNLMRPLLVLEGDRPPTDQLQSLFNGAQIAGPGAGAGVGPEQAWLQALDGEDGARFVVERVHALRQDHAVVHGLLRRRHLAESDVDDGSPDRVEEATVQMEWTRERRSDFKLARLTLGAYAPAPDRCRSRDGKGRTVDC